MQLSRVGMGLQYNSLSAMISKPLLVGTSILCITLSHLSPLLTLDVQVHERELLNLQGDRVG